MIHYVANNLIWLAIVNEESSSEAFDPLKTPREGRLTNRYANKRRLKLKEQLEAARGRKSQPLQIRPKAPSGNPSFESSNYDSDTPSPPTSNKDTHQAQAAQEVARGPRLKRPPKKVMEEIEDRRELEAQKRSKEAKTAAGKEKRRREKEARERLEEQLAQDY